MLIKTILKENYNLRHFLYQMLLKNSAGIYLFKRKYKFKIKALFYFEKIIKNSRINQKTISDRVNLKGIKIVNPPTNSHYLYISKDKFKQKKYRILHFLMYLKKTQRLIEYF